MERWQSEGRRKLDPLDQERKVWGEAAFSEPGTRVEGAPGGGRKQAQVLGSSLALHPEPGLRLLGPVLSS